MSIVQPKWQSDPGQMVVVVGGANLDILGRADGALAPGDSAPGEVQVWRGGVARNVAENLALLGQKVYLVSAVGDDEGGRRLINETASAGVDVQGVHCIAGMPTATYLSLHGPDGALGMAVNDMRVMDMLTPQLLAAHQPLLNDAKALVLDCNLSAASLGWLAAHAPRAAVFADGVSAAKCGRLRPWLRHIHTLKLNRLEASVLSGFQVQNLRDAEAAAGRLIDAGVRNVVISLGKVGVCWLGEEGGFGHRVARPVHVVNTNGAGDALLAGVVCGHLAAMPLAQAAAWGALCAEQTLLSTAANATELPAGTICA
jgi:pseudouridine kinase